MRGIGLSLLSWLLAEQGFDDLLIAYPTARASDLQVLRARHEEGKDIKLMVDAAALPPELGSAVLFPHAKAGELMGRLEEVILVDEEGKVEAAKTYRGMGACFF